jgi:hypothetical protein
VGGDGTPPGFYLKEGPLLKRIFGFGSRSIQAFGCVNCRNLQFNVVFSEKDLERYQQFEGEQPGVLERINSDPKELKD